MSFTFHAHVAEEAMAKVGRLFNASLDDILNELLQNARRSGATTVEITQINDPDLGDAISVADNGPGLANPEALFTLGRSAWDDQVISSEDAAGMGFFALANRGVKIIAQKRGSDQSWVLNASPSAFSGEALVKGAEGPADHRGLAIIFPQFDREKVPAAVVHAAKYCPLEVTLNGEEIERADFLLGAKHVEDWEGIRIGVFHEPSRVHSFSGHNVNFHGVTLYVPLPDLHQQFHHSFHARIDVDHCAALKLVLPARKEIVQDEFLVQLRTRIQMLYFELLAQEDRHSLARKDHALAQSLGVSLPDAAMLLKPFVPSTAEPDRYDYRSPERVSENAIIFEDADGPVEEQNVARAISFLPGGLPLFDPKPAFEGYTWYDALSRVALTGYRATDGATVQEIAPEDRFSVPERPEKLEVLLTQTDGDVTTDLCVETDVLVLSEDFIALDEADIHVTSFSTVTPGELVQFLGAALFSPSDDVVVGTYEQQSQWFSDEAEDLAITLLESSAAADLNLIKRILRRELTWRLPNDADISIRIRGRDIDVGGSALDQELDLAPHGSAPEGGCKVG